MSGNQFLYKSEDRQASWFLQTLVTDRITPEETDGAYSVTEHRVPSGYETPYHLHHDSLEAFYMIEGEITVYMEDNSFKARSGDTVLIPAGYDHGYQVTSNEPAKKLILFSPAGFEQYFHDAGQPAEQRVIPESSKSEVEDLENLAPEYDIELYGPLTEVIESE